jgi:hypothetical protein
MSEQSYPLHWPTGWPRTDSWKRKDSRFQRSYSQSATQAARWHSMAEATSLLSAEMERLGARNAILSTNVELRVDGTPYSNRKTPDDVGAAVYFTLKGRRVALACDKWRRVECNVWALAKHIESLRGQERWGVGSVEQAFAGYTALPGATAPRDWWVVLGVSSFAPISEIEAAFRTAAKRAHPDLGGSNDAMTAVNVAYDAAKKARGLS